MRILQNRLKLEAGPETKRLSHTKPLNSGNNFERLSFFSGMFSHKLHFSGNAKIKRRRKNKQTC